jgi:predicted GNAT family acetyltransferase
MTQEALTSAPEARQRPVRWVSGRRARVLLCASGVSFMIMLDSNIVAVSLPSIARNLNATFADIEWVVSAYVLRGYAALLVAWLVHKLREEGVTPFLHVFTDNVSAIALCERLGFTTRKTLRLTVLSRAAGA